MGVQHLCQFTVVILHTMSLINDHVSPPQLQCLRCKFRFHNQIIPCSIHPPYSLSIKCLAHLSEIAIHCNVQAYVDMFCVTLDKAALSLMMYSYVVSSTLNLAAFNCGTSKRLVVGDPL